MRDPGRVTVEKFIGGVSESVAVLGMNQEVNVERESFLQISPPLPPESDIEQRRAVSEQVPTSRGFIPMVAKAEGVEI
jgi:hypothetical protein